MGTVRSLRYLSVVLPLAGALGLMWTAPAAEAQRQGLIVEGKITNATPGGGGVSGVPVVLHQRSPAGRHDIEAVTDGDGRFRFDGIAFDPASAYGVSARYQEALYGRDIDLSDGSLPPISLTVYDAVNGADVLSASSASVLFAWADKSSQTISALEIISLANDSARTYVPGPGPMDLLRFGLPPGAQGLQVDTALPGAGFVQVDRGFALVTSVPPGEHEISYTYRFPYSETGYAFTRSFAYGAGNLRVLAPVEVLKLSSAELGSPDTVTIGERAYQLLQASDLPRGARVSLELTGLPGPSLVERLGRGFGDIRFEFAGPVGLGLLMALLIAYALWRRQTLGHEAERPHAPAADDERRTLRRLIVELESSFEAGALTEQEYRRRHTVLSSRLASLVDS